MLNTNYFVRNLETGKLELHFEKTAYTALDDAAKARIKSAFLWGRASGCWISRAKDPNLYGALAVARGLGLEDGGSIGERLSFAEQMERKAERAERRADRCDARAEAAAEEAERLQKPINDMRGDTAFFTQPNINSAGGRAFTRRREKMFASFERSFDEFRKSEYWQGRAATARRTAEQKELKDRAFLDRRIREREIDIRKLQRSIQQYENEMETAEGERAENIQKNIDRWLDMLEMKLDELGFYQDCLDAVGGITFSRDNVKPGYLVKIRRYGVVEVLSVGPKNFKAKDFGWPMQYAEILEIVKAQEPKPQAHPFTVGEEFTCTRWNPSIGRHGDTEKITARIIRATDKSVTLQVGEEKPFVRKPYQVKWYNEDGRKWGLQVTDWRDGTVYKLADDPKGTEEKPLSLAEFAAQHGEV